MNDTHIGALLDELTPSYDDRVGNWDRVVADARQTTRPRASVATRWPLGLFAAATAAAAALVLAWPFDDHHGTVLDRALAAVGNGPVLHATLRGEWGGTLVDLSTGARTPIYGDNEVWFDTRTGETHQIERLGGIVQGEDVYKPHKPETELAALGREYREALESRTARVAGEDTIDGEPAVWITIHSELLPDVADGKDHEWAQQVAVSKRTYKPVALRETRDAKPSPGTLQRVLDLQMIAREESDFTAARPAREGTAFKQGREPISREQAATVLGETPLWLGAGYEGLPLAAVYRETTSVGHEPRVGPIVWRDEQTSVVLFYGSVGDDPTTYLERAVPLYDKPYVALTESTRISPFRRGAGSYRRGAGSYVPPEGSVFITAGETSGYLQLDGIQIGIDAGGERALLAAARALTPMP